MPIDALSNWRYLVSFARYSDLLAIAKFLLCLVYGLKFGNAKRFLYIKFIRYSYSVFCLYVGLCYYVFDLLVSSTVGYSNFESLITH